MLKRERERAKLYDLKKEKINETIAIDEKKTLSVVFYISLKTRVARRRRKKRCLRTA